jgi:hypothetical protein
MIGKNIVDYNLVVKLTRHTMANVVVKWGQFITLIDLTTLILTIVAIVVFYSFVQWFCHTQLKRPPRPFPIWPLLGNLPLLGKIPHQDLYKLSKKYGDIMELKLGSIRVVVISSPQMAEQVLKTHDHLLAFRPKAIISQSISYGGLTIAFSSQGDYWRRLRMIHASELLNAKNLHASKNVRDEEISSLLHDYFQDCKVIEFI